VKPFHIRELLARVRALTRRPGKMQEIQVLSYGDLHLDASTRLVSCRGHELTLTARETELLSAFIQHPGTVFSREQLVLKVWGSDSEIEPGNVDNYISFLRKRLRELKSACEIKTIYGTGYRLEGPAHA
ncbi:DNA-binding response regulator, partial [Blautia sp. An249]|uniref:winged helix-turn-helix domain-containing protein n=1 Tax=Blautia sp. An249 TaxID=1965603 RepID=UPI000B5697DA